MKRLGTPVPTALRLIRGNPSKRPLPKNEPVVPLAQPDPPPFLCDDAKEEWVRICGTLHAAGLMTEIDRAALAAYAAAYGRWAQAERAINRLAESGDVNSGLTILTSNGNVIQNPLIGIANKAKTAVVRFAAEFGMTPSARSRVSVTPQEKDAEENKAARHF